MNIEKFLNKDIDRREFLKGTGMAAVWGGGPRQLPEILKEWSGKLPCYGV